MNDHDFPRQEKTRICPSCRCQISVLATKCRFCGEEVGKPKEESRTLSIHDLGGEQVYHRAPSGSVIDALESFRVEETMRETQESGDASGLGGLGLDSIEGGAAGDTGFSFDTEPSSTFSASRTMSSSNDIGGRVKLAIGVVAVLALLVVGATMGPRLLGRFNESKADAVIPQYTNQAPSILRSGGAPIDALSAAVEAIQHEDSAKNRRIAEDAVAAIEKQVKNLLNAAPYSEENLTKASTIATHAAELYPTETTRGLSDEAKEDYRLYRMLFIGNDKSTQEAIFQLNKPGDPEVRVKKGELLEGRFKVRALGGERRVTLTDTKRGNRVIVFEQGSFAMPLD